MWFYCISSVAGDILCHLGFTLWSSLATTWHTWHMTSMLPQLMECYVWIWLFPLTCFGSLEWTILPVPLVLTSPNCPCRTVKAVNTSVRVVAYQAPWWSFNKRNLTVESNSWTTLLYYVCCLQETFRRGTAKMTPCWLHLVASFSHVIIIVHVKAIDQWSSIDPELTALEGLALVLVLKAR